MKLYRKHQLRAIMQICSITSGYYLLLYIFLKIRNDQRVELVQVAAEPNDVHQDNSQSYKPQSHFLKLLPVLEVLHSPLQHTHDYYPVSYTHLTLPTNREV
eukprot:TRINITY_DN2813_c0_g3_i2.p1 TRINITY_DN2813_c0_g3~~TRINITY_DN2813_c0_g3_i2.p1  ORF type:complete len:101 (+),score=0.35 TRINITY_DN2813_c0_g3_i2:157-459(+)